MSSSSSDLIEPVTAFTATADGLSRMTRRWEVAEPKGAVALVHGIGEHSGRHGAVGSALAAAGYDVLAYDNRGFGQSGGRRAHVDAFADYLDDIEHVLEERRSLGVPVILMGHSLGGLMSATYLVSDRPQPDLAILSAPALQAQVPVWQRVLAPVLSKVAPRLFIPDAIDATLLSRDPEVQQAYVADPLVFGGATAKMAAEVFATMESTTESMDRLRVQTYVIHGGEDGLVPLEASDVLARHELAERRVWAGLRHECFNEPEGPEVIAEMIAWLDGQAVITA